MVLPARAAVTVVNLGKLGYLPSLKIQERLVRLHLDRLAGVYIKPVDNYLLLVEHPPVYTVGKREKQYTNVEEIKLKSLGAEFYRTQRGGLITFHGPGQLVAYPILNLADFVKGMRWYISSLENTLIELCAHYGVSARTTEDTGVWVKDCKIAAIGVHARRFITSHGIGLNCNTDLLWYDHITPCGIPDKGVTSLTQEIGHPITVNDVIEPFVKAFSKQFSCDINWADKQFTEHMIEVTGVS